MKTECPRFFFFSFSLSNCDTKFEEEFSQQVILQEIIWPSFWPDHGAHLLSTPKCTRGSRIWSSPNRHPRRTECHRIDEDEGKWVSFRERDTFWPWRHICPRTSCCPWESEADYSAEHIWHFLFKGFHIQDINFCLVNFKIPWKEWANFFLYWYFWASEIYIARTHKVHITITAPSTAPTVPYI